MEYLLKISICRRRFAHCRVIFEKGSSTRSDSMAIESLHFFFLQQKWTQIRTNEQERGTPGAMCGIRVAGRHLGRKAPRQTFSKNLIPNPLFNARVGNFCASWPALNQFTNFLGKFACKNLCIYIYNLFFQKKLVRFSAMSP